MFCASPIYSYNISIVALLTIRFVTQVDHDRWRILEGGSGRRGRSTEREETRPLIDIGDMDDDSAARMSAQAAMLRLGYVVLGKMDRPESATIAKRDLVYVVLFVSFSFCIPLVFFPDSFLVI